MSEPDPTRTVTSPNVHGNPGETVTGSAPSSAAPLRFAPPAVGSEVGTLGPYRLIKELGKGGMGAVYLALDTRLERKLALKVMLPEFAADPDAKGRFLREAKAAAKVAHDNVVTVYEADERDGVPYIAMQLLQGYPLDAFLKKKGTPALHHVVRMMSEAALGLAAAHKMGLVHRDIKPANLWLEAPNGRVKVLDFGLAKPVGTESELTKSGAVVGTPAYMSPEQARGHKVDHRTDLYSLGAVLYRLCTGKSPFAGEHVMAVLAAVLTDDPAPVRELNPAVPEPLARLIHQLLAKKPEDRPQTANEVAKSLRGILDQLLAPNAPASPPDVSTSMPVVVEPVQVQPEVVTAMHITAAPDFTLAHPEDDEDESDSRDAVTEVERTEKPKAKRKKTDQKKTRGKGVLIASIAGAVLLVGVVVAVILSQTGKKKEPDVTKGPDVPVPPVPGDEKGRPNPKEPTDPKGSLPPTHKNGVGMEFVKVPKGTAWLLGGGGHPGHTKVEIEQDFYLGKYEVTQEEWQAVMGSNPSHFSRTGPGKDAVKDISDADLKRFPVEEVSWDDCQEFIKKLNEREKESGWVYRLPKQAEWEYACRGGPVDKADSAFDFYFAKPSNMLAADKANFRTGNERFLNRTCRVGSYEPNLLGLHDIHGNVGELCDDPEKTLDGASLRVNRGGSWFNGSIHCPAAFRYATPPSDRYDNLGLRLARVPSVPVGKVSAADPKPDVPGTFTNCIGMKFVPVPKGTGWLGGGGGKPGETKVEFKEDFYLGKYEVTQEEWEKVMGKNPSAFKRGHAAVKDIADAELKRFPVEEVSWDDCQEFIKKLNEREKESGWVYRLPKQAEWEYACRGGPVDKADSGFDFYFAKPTNKLLLDQANFSEAGKGLQRPCKVGSYAPNLLGLHDMHGNVSEWCEDKLPPDPKDANAAPRYAYHGGYWDFDSGYLKALHYNTAPSSGRFHNMGLRLARAPAGK